MDKDKEIEFLLLRIHEIERALYIAQADETQLGKRYKAKVQECCELRLTLQETHATLDKVLNDEKDA